MKKTVLTFLILVDFALQAFAYDFEVDGIYYYICSHSESPEVWVVSCSQPEHNCYSGDVVIPETVTYEGVTYTVTQILNNAFQDCTELTSVSIPNTMTTIMQFAFLGCTSLDSIHIPNSVTSLDATAFNNTGWFNNQPEECILYLDGWCLGHKGEAPLVELNIDEGTLRVAENAFMECETLVSVTLPNSLISISPYAFERCYELKDVEFGESIEKIMFGAFVGCHKLEEAILPASVTTIESFVFSGCYNLSNLVLPNSITTIGDYAFEYCTSLPHVTLPNAITEINVGVFESSGLKTITIPEGVTTIGASAFFECDSLTAVTISQSVTEIKYAAFAHNQSLATVTCLGNVPATLQKTSHITCFDDSCNAALIVPCGCVDIYDSSDWGEVFWRIMEDCSFTHEHHQMINVYPNPTSEIITIEGIEPAEVQVYNTFGQLVKSVQGTKAINVGTMPEGMYLLRIADKKGNAFLERIVKE